MVAFPTFLAIVATLAAVVTASPIEARAPTTVQIHPAGNTNLCLTADSTNPSQVYVTIQNCGCNNPLQDWLVSKGNTQIQMAKNTNYCVIGNLNPLRGWFPQDGGKLMTANCGASGTTWNFSGGKFKTTGSDSYIPPRPANNFCMDNTDGKLVAGNVPQYWTCYAGNGNQQWTTTPAL